MTVWREDVLGAGFECTDLDLGADSEGPLVATLVRALPAKHGWFTQMFHGKRLLESTRVLYVHGWSDYFFQRELAAFWTSRGASFYALDLRKYGRSLREGQTPGYIEDLDDYHEEIDQALEIMRADAGERHRDGKLILLGHSTGGLVLSLWASKHPGGCDALVLNSPWLEFQLTSAGRQLLRPLVNLGARVNARDIAPQIDSGFYSRAQRAVMMGDEYAALNTQWRPDRSHPVLAGWLRAVLDGHEQVSQGLFIAEPIAVLLSTKSHLTLRWSDELTHVDTVLDVDEVAKASLRLGAEMTMLRIDGALHDTFLSAAAPRAAAYAALEHWLTGWAAREAAAAARHD
ncbi:alpha/beta hydrolase [Leucobacter sp. HY1910]